MASIHLVSHCYAKTLPQYAVFLRAQLSAFSLCDQKNIMITVCYNDNDEATMEVLSQFKPELGDDLEIVAMPLDMLFRRSIGRNLVAITSRSDVVWFTDVDYIPEGNCLKVLSETWDSFFPKPVMCHPSYVQVHPNHGEADKVWQEAFSKKFEKESILFLPSYKDYVPKQNTRAIGGCQIVDGNFARKYGYLQDDPKWRQPVKDTSKPFPCFKDDVKFRGVCEDIGGKSIPIKLPTLYRLRHTEVTYKAT